MRVAKWLSGGVGRGVRISTVGVLMAGLGASVQAQGLTTVGFDTLPSGAFSSYTEDGFLVTAATPNWRYLAYGAPAHSIVFSNTSGAIAVSRPGATFQFSSIGLYASVTSIPYAIRGFLGGQQVFELVGTNPNTLGNFATIASPSAAFIDQLTVTLTNPSPTGNPMGLDNITFGAIAAVPEPSTLMMGALGVAAIAWRRRRAQA